MQKILFGYKIKKIERATEDEIMKLILGSSSKSSDLDPVTTSVLENCK